MQIYAKRMGRRFDSDLYWQALRANDSIGHANTVWMLANPIPQYRQRRNKRECLSYIRAVHQRQALFPYPAK